MNYLDKIRLLEGINDYSQNESQHLRKQNVKGIAATRGVTNYGLVLDECIEFNYLITFDDDNNNKCFQLTNDGIEFVKKNSTRPKN